MQLCFLLPLTSALPNTVFQSATYIPNVLRIADNIRRLSIPIVWLLDRYKVRYAHVLKHLDVAETGPFVGEVHANG
jgi:hypothetical protein